MIRVHLYDKWLHENDFHRDLDEYCTIFKDACARWGEHRIKLNKDGTDHFEIWMEFKSEEEAALFKLSEL